MRYDKRKLKRYDVFLIVEFKPLRSPGGFSIGITRDLSPEGFSLETQTIECQHGDIMEFRLKHPDAEWTVDISGEVIWRNNSWYKYIIGIKFLNVDEEQNAKILKLISAVRDAENKPELTGKSAESLPETEKDKMSEALSDTGAMDNQLPDSTITLKDSGPCKFTGSERPFIARDVSGTSRDNYKENIRMPENTDDSEKNLKETLLRDIETRPEILREQFDGQSADRKALMDLLLKAEAESEYEDIYAANIDTGHMQDTVQAPLLTKIHKLENNRKKKLWLYIPLIMLIVIIFVIALPVMIEKFNHSSIGLVTGPAESTDSSDIEKDKTISDSFNVQMSSKDLDEPSGPSPVERTGISEAIPVGRDKEVNFREASAIEDSSVILPTKSIVKNEMKNKRSEDTATPAMLEKTVNNTSQLNNANTFRTETAIGANPLRDNVEKSRKIDLTAKIDKPFKARGIQDEKLRGNEVVIETEKTPENKPSVKTEAQPVTSQVVKLEEPPETVPFASSESIPVVEQEVASEEKKEGIKKAEPVIKIREMPSVALLVKRDKSRSTQNNSSTVPSISAADLSNKWKPIGSTKSGVPLFIAPDNISYPYEHVVNLMVKASVNKKDFIDLLAINCSQIKLRILEERNGNNPAFSSYSNEWKDIIPDSMVLYNSACPEKK